ncbi:hypothetical protein BKA66DRAFT_572719 [Pyrenochaeta sp. MPI-SDFR-AT-0127]|nr:hypothetical protein BKA66DRAFT_572719 [Pyrenochaeta sp. MPI-SDFR-AT-0127]
MRSAYINSLSQDELALVTDKEWERELTPLPEFTYNGDNIILKAHRLYIKGDNDDKCKEEVDDNSDIEEWLNRQENEYKT